MTATGMNARSTGYSLHIPKGLADTHRDQIWVEEDGLENGSTIFVEIPLAS